MPADMKSTIAATYMQMIKKGNVDKITVKALIEECHISRQTFYYHFQDIMDVLEWSFRQVTKRLVERTLEAEGPQEAVRIFVSSTVDSYPMMNKLMESQRRKEMELLMIDAVETYLRELARYKNPNLTVNFSNMEITLRFIACGMLGVLLKYGGMPQVDTERLSAQLYQILTREIPHAKDMEKKQDRADQQP